MQTILEAIFEHFLVKFFKWIGALVRWPFYCFRKPFKEVLNDDGVANVVISVVVMVGLGIWLLVER
ncbi:hypothetical protein L3C95_16025 [Chitinophaga filiformis]|uniref:hypothetical protein n=1 Tax=Chitinophaga filiformis TaxID=104663 RepID=UPI001F1B616E|nr:hypothetical protein [Chitinophaga filiformis]MCF6404406.1 hypothetical protein [Chitinophaga filiformis]